MVMSFLCGAGMDKYIPWPGPPCFIQPIEVSVVISSSSVVITGDSWDSGTVDSWEEAGDFTSDRSAGAARRSNETRTKTHQPDTLATASQAPLSIVSPHKCDSWINKVSSLENVFGQL